MCLYVKQFILGTCLLGFASLSSLWCHATEAHRQIYLAPGVDMALAAPFAQTLHPHTLWQLPLAADETQVVRLIEATSLIPQPFYWMQTRLDEQHLRIAVKVSLEIWSGPHLRWQRVISQHKDLRFMGPELRGVGQALLPQLARLPQGSLTELGLTPAREHEIRQRLWQHSFYLLQQDYQQYAEQSEREISE